MSSNLPSRWLSARLVQGDCQCLVPCPWFWDGPLLPGRPPQDGPSGPGGPGHARWGPYAGWPRCGGLFPLRPAQVIYPQGEDRGQGARMRRRGAREPDWGGEGPGSQPDWGGEGRNHCCIATPSPRKMANQSKVDFGSNLTGIWFLTGNPQASLLCWCWRLEERGQQIPLSRTAWTRGEALLCCIQALNWTCSCNAWDVE